MGGLGCGPLLAGLIAEFAARRCTWRSGLTWRCWRPRPRSCGRCRNRYVLEGPAAFARSVCTPCRRSDDFAPAALAGFAGFAVLGLFTAVAPAFPGQVLGVRQPTPRSGLIASRYSRRRGWASSPWTRVPGAALPGRLRRADRRHGRAAPGLADVLASPAPAGGWVAGFGQGLSFRPGLAAVNAAAPEARRAEVASIFFVVAYVAISVPVVGEGLLAQLTSLRTAGLVFAAAVAAIARPWWRCCPPGRRWAVMGPS